MTSYRQLQSDDVSDQFDLDSQPDAFKPRGEVEVQIEPTRARTKSRVRLPNTSCTKNKVIIVLVIMLLILVLVASLTIYELDKHGVQCHNEAQENKATTNPPTEPPTTASTATTTKLSKPATTQPVATNGEPFPWSDFRLPSSAIPFEYAIFLHPNLSSFEVRGSVSIHFNTKEEVSFIILHAKDIDILKPESIELVDHPEQSVGVEKLLINKKQDQISIKFEKPIDKDVHCILTLEFNYTLAEGLDGFYRSSYKKNGQPVTMASTQFEPSSARQAFPCFDEPSMKANFSLKMVHDENHITLFNMPAKKTNEEYKETLLLDTYQTTVPMSTYLVAFVVCDFSSIKDVTSSGTQVAMYAPVDQISQANLALEVVNKTIPFYEEFFDIAYPLPKQDMIAIPDFSAGAMENWGLITYRGSSVLYKPNVTSTTQETWIVVTVTHELAHQWFGNLVTMQWWNDLWLNEGFASFVEYIGADHFRPEWHMLDKFIIETTHTAMAKDQKAYSHPIRVTVKDTAQISEIFDSISYSKGSTMLKMLQSFLMNGDKDIMVLGIQRYLKQYQFKNAVTSDLWNAISTVAKENGHTVNVSAMMDTWILQMGFPVINVTKTGSVTQQRFLIFPEGNASNEFSSAFGYKWTIPVTYFTDTNPKTKTVVMEHDQARVNLDVAGARKWFKVNSNQAGMYRVNYDKSTWNALSDQLLTDHTVFSAADRAHLIDDVFHLAWAGYVNYSIALDLSRYLVNESAYVPIQSALESLSSVGNLLYGTKGYAYYKKYVLNLFNDRVTALGKEDTGEHLDRLTRGTLLSTFRRLGDEDTLNWAYTEYKKWMEPGSSTVGVNLHYTVLCGGVQKSGIDEWKYAWNKYQNTSSPTEKSILQKALACTQDMDILSDYLNLALDTSKIRLQDSDSVISEVAYQRSGSYLALHYVIDNWDVIQKSIGTQPFVMESLISDTTWWISKQFDYDCVSRFFSKVEALTAERTMKQTLEDILMRISWRKKYEKQITLWFKEATTQAS